MVCLLFDVFGFDFDCEVVVVVDEVVVVFLGGVGVV